MCRKHWVFGAGIGLMMLVLSSLSAAAAQPLSITTNLSSQSDSGVSGTATVTDLGNGGVMVEIRSTASGPDARPAHIHEGRCPTETPPQFALTTIVDGLSRTEVDVSLADLVATPHAIDIHKSAEDIGIHVACGDLVSAAAIAQQPAGMANLTSQSDSGISGTVTLTDLDGESVMVDLRASGAGTDARPAHIHQGNCPTETPPQYTLTTIVDGVSRTVVAVSLVDLLATPHAIDIHKSAEDIGIHVACGDVIRMETDYTVANGDTLSSLAGRWLGDANRWPSIFNANRDRVSNPNQILPGQVLRIPR